MYNKFNNFVVLKSIKLPQPYYSECKYYEY